MDGLIRRGDVLGNINKRRYHFGKASLDEAFKAVHKAPTVDAVPVVRCKECMFSKKYRTETLYCELHCNYAFVVNPDGYCSRGAKMNGGK